MSTDDVLPPVFPAPVRQAAVFTGWSSDPNSLDGWPNSLSIDTTEGYDPATETIPAQDDPDNEAELDWADAGGSIGLVLVDTNYKPTRPGQHPVRLTRPAAAKAAAALVATISDTLTGRRLRPAAARELLAVLQDIDGAVYDLREQLIQHLSADIEEPTP